MLTVQIGEEDLIQRLSRLAQLEDRSRASQVKHLLRRGLAEAEAQCGSVAGGKKS
jgi:hypothetical protein